MRLPNPTDLPGVSRGRLRAEAPAVNGGPSSGVDERLRAAQTLMSELLEAAHSFALDYPELDRQALQVSVRRARSAFAGDVEASELRDAGRELCYRLRHYAAEQEALITLRDTEVRRILDLVSGALGHLSASSLELTTQVEETAQEMEQIAGLDDLRQVRAGLGKNLAALRATNAHQGSVVPMAEVLREVEELRSRIYEVEQVASRDPLTTVYNRRAFDLRLEKLIAADDPFTLVLCDLDDFKRLNDTCGHLLGDECLRRTAAQLQAIFRDTDLVARLGGDEFAVVVSKLTPAQVAQRIRDQFTPFCPKPRPDEAHLDEAHLHEAGPDPEDRAVGSFTASFGVAQRRPDEPADALLERADRCLYRAKRDQGTSVVWE